MEVSAGRIERVASVERGQNGPERIVLQSRVAERPRDEFQELPAADQPLHGEEFLKARGNLQSVKQVDEEEDSPDAGEHFSGGGKDETRRRIDTLAATRREQSPLRRVGGCAGR